MNSPPRTTENIGFLSIIDNPRLGLIGGYLVLNPSGRPLEFHCTTPVKPNRAQEILYGETLEPFLYGEQIAQTLLRHSKTPVLSVLTDSSPILAVQDFLDYPVIYVFRSDKKKELSPLQETESSVEISAELNESLRSFGIDNSHLACRADSKDDGLPRVPSTPGLETNRWREAKIGNRIVAIPFQDSDTWEHWVELLKNTSRTIDLVEPFMRITLAVEEAQRAA